MDSVLPVSIDPVHDFFVHICEHYLVAGLRKYGSDKSSADIAGSELNCCFHL